MSYSPPKDAQKVLGQVGGGGSGDSRACSPTHLLSPSYPCSSFSSETSVTLLQDLDFAEGIDGIK